jgi:hypothetical protein
MVKLEGKRVKTYRIKLFNICMSARILDVPAFLGRRGIPMRLNQFGNRSGRELV